MPCSADQLTGFLRSLHEKGVDEPCKQFSSAGSTAPHPREHSRWARGRRRARARSARLARLHIRGSVGRRGCYSSGVAARARADPEAAGGPRSPRAGQPRRHVSGHRGSGLGDESKKEKFPQASPHITNTRVEGALTFCSSKTTCWLLESPYHSKPRKVASWRSLKTAASLPLGNRMSLTPQKLWLGSPKQGRVPGSPVYREKEAMYDEIIELKKSLHTQKSDVDLMRTKLRRLEEENSRKDRQIEQLLDPSRGPDFVRTLAEKRPDTGWVVNGLKQRVLKLEQQCKDKDSTIHKLQTDMKTTNLEEMQIAMETYYEEIHRLQTLLASSEATGRKPPMEKKSGLKRQKKMSSALLSLSRSVQELTEENRTLKEDLDRVLSNSPTVSRTKGYTEWSKPRLLRRIAELEKKLNSMESPRSHASEADSSDPLGHSASSSAVRGQPRSEAQEESERLRGAVRSLRGERKALQAQLQEREYVARAPQAPLRSQRRGVPARLRPPCQHGGSAPLMVAAAYILLCGSKMYISVVKDSQPESEPQGPGSIDHGKQKILKGLPGVRQAGDSPGVRDASVALQLPPQEQPRPCRPASSPSQQDDTGAPCTCSEGRRQAAARLLQARWKAYRHQKTKAVLDEAATVLQAAFRGHQARVKLLSSKVCGSESPSMPGLPSQGRGEGYSVQAGALKRGLALGSWCDPSPSLVRFSRVPSLGAAARGASTDGRRQLRRL
ncbi:PREDICTED: IQ domain-containing protein E [Hipposideros armiger]|uniref:IQ domain-containing protein E n=1 Tax=Hipposideros armiger TaxID=186990 RepID=A0A8B7QWA4_HIPAR|nr:PREDICTED: IQ domain-containing protein E [Hipposideros armiger]